MSTFVPVCSLLFTTVLAILDKPWKLLYYQFKVKMQVFYAEYDKPELFKDYGRGEPQPYAVLNRYKFNLTQGGQESAIQIVIQWSTYFAVCYWVATCSIINLKSEDSDSIEQSNRTNLCFLKNRTELDILDEENHFDWPLGVSGFFSILSLTIAQLTMVHTQHETSIFGLFLWQLLFSISGLFNSLSSSVLLIHTATKVLDLILLKTSSLGISVDSSLTTVLIYFLFMMAPGILSYLIDRILIHHQPNIIEDDFWIRRTCSTDSNPRSSCFHACWRKIKWMKKFFAGIAKQILEGLVETLRLPVSKHFSHHPNGYHTTCLNLNSVTLTERFIAHCLFYIWMLLLNVTLSLIS